VCVSLFWGSEISSPIEITQSSGSVVVTFEVFTEPRGDVRPASAEDSTRSHGESRRRVRPPRSRKGHGHVVDIWFKVMDGKLMEKLRKGHGEVKEMSWRS